MNAAEARKHNNELRRKRIKEQYTKRHHQERIIEEDVLEEIANQYCIEVSTVKAIVRGWKKSALLDKSSSAVL
jgi:predicted DsbA family dithiol-disulfide isomerase